MSDRRNSTRANPDDTRLQLDEAIEFFSQNPGRRTNLRVQVGLDTIKFEATEKGLSQDNIQDLMNVITSGKVGVAVVGKLIRCLLPTETVPIAAVLKAVSWMCTNKPSSPIQALLIQWLLLVFDVIEDVDKLHALYGIIFFFLENTVMCPHVCHLLARLTRKEHIKFFRIQQLLQLQRNRGAQPYIIGLLAVYKSHVPHLLALSIPRSRKNFFRPLDRTWVGVFKRVQERRLHLNPLADVDSTTTGTRQASKRRRIELIPYVQVAPDTKTRSGRSPQPLKSTKFTPPPVPFLHVKSFKDLLKTVDRIQLPGQMACVLRDRNLQYVMMLHSDSSAAARLSYWLDHVLHEVFLNSGLRNDEEKGEELLKLLVQLSDFLQEGIPICENFLAKYLHLWNGRENRSFILKLITRFRLQPFPVFNDLILEPLRKLFFSSSVYFKCQIIVCFTELLHNLAGVEWPRYKYSLQLRGNTDDVATSFQQLPNYMSVFDDQLEEFNAVDSIKNLIEFVDDVISVALVLERDNALLMHCVLDFYDLVSELYPRYQLPLLLVPSRSLVYRSLLANSAMPVSRICGLIFNYRKSYCQMKEFCDTSASPDEAAACRDSLGPLNNFILDICDSLWRDRAFISTEKDSVFQLLSSDLLQKLGISNTKQILSVYLHPGLLGFACKFLKTTQPEERKCHPVSIKRVRNTFLEFLDEHGAVGISQYIGTFILRKQTKST